MTEHTFITGKDADLESTIARIQAELSAVGFEIEQTRWLNPVPNCWSVHIRDQNCPILFTNGKGASQKAALASALGEFIERLASQYFFGDFHWRKSRAQGFVHDPAERWFVIDRPGVRPEGLLNESLWRHYLADEYRVRTEDWRDFNSGENAICALPFTRVRDGETVYFPANVVGNLYVSNGLTAGNTPFEARTQGLSEVFERFVKNRVISERLALPAIPDAVVASYPSIAASIHALREQGFGLRLLDASLGGKYPVICVTLIDPASGGVFASFGAHPDFSVAFERTVTELLQGRALDDLHHFHPPTTDDELVSDPQNLELHFIDSSGWLSWAFFRDTPDFPFVHWQFSGADNAQSFTTLCAMVEAEGTEVYVADYTHLGLYACRVLVQGMSEVYPIEELYERNNNSGLALVPFAETLDPKEADALLEAIDAADLDWLLPVTDAIGLAADPGSAWSNLRIGEWRAHALFASRQSDDADEREALLDWLTQVPPLPDDRRRIYQAARSLNALRAYTEDGAIDDFGQTLGLLFTEGELATATAFLDGHGGFIGLTPLGEGFAASARHQSLMAAYQRAFTAKLSAGSAT